MKDCIRSLRGNRLFKIPRRRRPRKRRLKSEFAFFQSPSRILQLIYFVKLQGNPFWAEFLRTILSSERERKFSRRFLTSSIKGEIRHFPVYREVTAKKCTKKLDARAELLFCPFNLLLFWRFSLSSPSWHLKVPNSKSKSVRLHCRPSNMLTTILAWTGAVCFLRRDISGD